MKSLGRCVAAVLALGFIVVAPLGADEPMTAPSDHQGLDVQVLQSVDLGPEIEGMEGRQLRFRMLTIEPGGHIAVHSHQNRPAVAYVLQGATTVTFGDGAVRRFSAGDSLSANAGTTHWHRNNEQENVVILTADVFQPKQ